MATLLARVYIETSIISYLTAWPSQDVVIAGHQQVTRDWWLRRRDRYELFISQAVQQEILAEVHRVKDALGGKYGYDLDRLFRGLQAAERRRGAKLVTLTPQRSSQAGQRALPTVGTSRHHARPKPTTKATPKKLPAA